MTKTKQIGAATEKVDKLVPPPRDAFQARDFRNVVWDAQVADTVPPHHIATPKFYENMHPMHGEVRTFDKVEVHSGRFWAEVLVTQAIDGRVAQVKVLNLVDMPTQLSEDLNSILANFDISFHPQHRWVVTRKSDGVRLGTSVENGWNTRADAELFVRNHPTVRGQGVTYS